MIQPVDLHTVWAAPDNTRLTAKQFSFRLPVHVAAKLSALCEMFPQKTRTQLVADLLATALEDFERSFPPLKGKYVGQDSESGERIYKNARAFLEYQNRVNHFYKELESALGNEDPKPLYESDIYTIESDMS